MTFILPSPGRSSGASNVARWSEGIGWLHGLSPFGRRGRRGRVSIARQVVGRVVVRIVGHKSGDKRHQLAGHIPLGQVVVVRFKSTSTGTRPPQHVDP